MTDRFEDLRTYTTVIACGGINAAAAELGIAKSAVSRRLSDLEARLGAKLIERTNRSFEPTAVGAEYAQRAVTLLASLDALDRSASASGSDEIVTIAAPASMIAHVLLPAIGRTGALTDTIPHFMTSDGLEAETAADIVICEAGAPPSASRKLFSTTAFVCASPGYLETHGRPANRRDLEAHVAITISDGRDAAWRMGQGAWPAPRASTSVPNEEAAAAAAIAGLGLVQLPDYAVARDIAGGRLVRVLEGSAPPAAVVRAHYDPAAGIDVMRIVDELANAVG